MPQKNLIRIEEINLKIEEAEILLLQKIAVILELKTEQILAFKIVKKAIDSRNKQKIFFVYSVAVEIQETEKYFNSLTTAPRKLKEKIKRHKVRLEMPYLYQIPTISSQLSKKRPIVVGTGPSGLFAALILAQAGLKPIVIERGKDVDARILDVELFSQTGRLNPDSNVQFGEGGAGTFSDGKLNTLVNNPRIRYIFEELVLAGAPPEIAWDAKPHVGTDKLRRLVKNLRHKIIQFGGEVFFETCLTDLEIAQEKIVAVILNNKKRVLVDELVIATGHSARDTYTMLAQNNLNLIAKTFSMGVRIEHTVEMINRSQYGDFYLNPKLPTARYNLVSHSETKRSVYTFCMCPGGYVVGAASEKGGVVVNGMSEYAQAGQNSNSALLVNVTPVDFQSTDPLAGIEFQRYWEQKAFAVGGANYHAPAQLVGDFLANKSSTQIAKIVPTYQPGIKMTTLNDCLPLFVLESLREALPVLDRKIKGFASPEAILTGIETRSSAPVRILRDESFQSNIRGIYPTGEGAGYAGGIVSSAIDGIMVAEKILTKYS